MNVSDRNASRPDPSTLVSTAMPPTLATALTLFGVLYLLGRDFRRGATASSALWLPVMWLGITGSRFVSQGLDLSGGGGDNFTDDSPIDALYSSPVRALRTRRERP